MGEHHRRTAAAKCRDPSQTALLEVPFTLPTGFLSLPGTSLESVLADAKRTAFTARAVCQTRDSHIAFKSLAVIVAKLRAHKIASKGLNKYRPPSFYRGGKNSPETGSLWSEWGAKRISLRTSSVFRLTAGGRHVREVANTRGKSPSQEGEQRRADSPSRGAATPIRTPTTHILWRRFARLLLVNGWREAASDLFRTTRHHTMTRSN
jgi:hypothetical protein